MLVIVRIAYLEKPLDPPYLENTLAQKDQNLEDAPPLDSSVGALSGITMGPLADNNIALLVFDLRCHLRKKADLFLERVLRRLRLGHIDNTMDVERDLLRVRASPMFIVETIDVFSILACDERVVTVGYTSLVDLIAA